MKEAFETFDKTVKQYDFENPLVALKYKHTYKVVEAAKILSKRLRLSKEKQDLFLKCALLHDIGRFYQAEMIHSFQDKKLDHASYGVQYLFEENQIENYETNPKAQAIIKDVVYYHNKHQSKIPKLDEETSFYVSLVRDVDKIDIYRVYAEEISLYFNQKQLHSSLLEQFEKKTSIYCPKEIEKTKSDSFLVACAFIYDINEKESYQLLKEKGYLDLFFENVQVEAGSEELFQHIRKAVYQKLKEECYWQKKRQK